MIEEVVPGVWRAGTSYVNWYVVDGGDAGLTLVDAGLPGYRSQLDPALRGIGRERNDVRAVVLTHGHIDHVGMADVLAAEGAAIHLHPADRELAADARRNQTQRGVWRYAWQPGPWVFVAHCLRQGAAKPRQMPDTVALEPGVADLPGRPVVTHTPGHTDGSVVVEFRAHGAVFVGDLLCTVSMATGRDVAPRLQSRASNKNSDEARSSLEALADVTGRTVLPGHGKAWRRGVEDAVASARRVGCY